MLRHGGVRHGMRVNLITAPDQEVLLPDEIEGLPSRSRSSARSGSLAPDRRPATTGRASKSGPLGPSFERDESRPQMAVVCRRLKKHGNSHPPCEGAKPPEDHGLRSALGLLHHGRFPWWRCFSPALKTGPGQGAPNGGRCMVCPRPALGRPCLFKLPALQGYRAQSGAAVGAGLPTIERGAG